MNSYGIRVGHRTYDSAELTPFRRQPSGAGVDGRGWEVHYDPYDIFRVWVRNHREGGWITAIWRHLRTAPMPMGELAWDHARRILAQRGTDRRPRTRSPGPPSPCWTEPPTARKTNSRNRLAHRAAAAGTARSPPGPGPPPNRPGPGRTHRSKRPLPNRWRRTRTNSPT
ncbi:hypothetical protein [Streptomyces ossamyceticus]|uniref:hypothetical protein n=1 Tax=Streptomyces ossamyceticus TaxID=249581 RepID=UPI0039C8C4F8